MLLNYILYISYINKTLKSNCLSYKYLKVIKGRNYNIKRALQYSMMKRKTDVNDIYIIIKLGVCNFNKVYDAFASHNIQQITQIFT